MIRKLINRWLGIEAMQSRISELEDEIDVLTQELDRKMDDDCEEFVSEARVEELLEDICDRLSDVEDALEQAEVVC